MSKPTEADYTKLDSASLLDTLRDDAAKWAAAFNQHAVKLEHSPMDEGWLTGWFANAIEGSCDVRKRAQAAATPDRKWMEEARALLAELRPVLDDRGEQHFVITATNFYSETQWLARRDALLSASPTPECDPISDMNSAYNRLDLVGKLAHALEGIIIATTAGSETKRQRPGYLAGLLNGIADDARDALALISERDVGNGGPQGPSEGVRTEPLASRSGTTIEDEGKDAPGTASTAGPTADLPPAVSIALGKDGPATSTIPGGDAAAGAHAGLIAERDLFKRRLEGSEAARNSLAAGIANLQSALRTAQADLAEAHGEMERLKADLDSCRDSLNREAAARIQTEDRPGNYEAQSVLDPARLKANGETA